MVVTSVPEPKVTDDTQRPALCTLLVCPLPPPRRVRLHPRPLAWIRTHLWLFFSSSDDLSSGNTFSLGQRLLSAGVNEKRRKEESEKVEKNQEGKVPAKGGRYDTVKVYRGHGG